MNLFKLIRWQLQIKHTSSFLEGMKEARKDGWMDGWKEGREAGEVGKLEMYENYKN